MRFVQIGVHHINVDQIAHLTATKDRGENDATDIFFIGGEYVTVGGNPKRIRSMIRTLAAHLN